MFHTSTGRYIFSFAGTNGLKSAWTHPDSTYQYLVEDTSFDDNDQDSLSFEAISYARGSTQDPLQALIEYPSQPRGFAYLDIGQNLANALRHLHVFRLAGIFSRASRVVIWLGPVSEDSSEAFDKLRHLGEQVVSVEDDWVPSPGTVEPDWYRPDYKLPFSREIISAIEKLLRQDWFRRMWVLQESILASSQSIIHCGHSQIPWIIFSNAVCSLESKGGQFPKSFQDVLQAPVWMTLDPKPWSIADTFRVLIEHTKRLDLLGVWNPEKNRKTDCPSWVLDFREPKYVRKPLSHQFCTLNSACHVRFQPPDELRVTGIKIATLDHGPRMPPVDKDIWDGSDEDMIEIIRKVAVPDLDTAKYGTGESL
ncbi:hypothetical protein MRS44_001833 [Fusarium solani]|uniref:uncharacterized protein n=1 Tax=Fusarium solani TaxID=169388 RepID=UPI0032C414C1|nr:hypothetical protein MRS44_001833 [Fusarium solani]